MMRHGSGFVIGSFQGTGRSESYSSVCGPILGALYTVHKVTLKLTAQLSSVGLRGKAAPLNCRSSKARAWKTIRTSTINPSGWVAHFRVEKWDDRQDVPYRVRYMLKGASGRAQAHVWEGTIKANPVNKDEIVVALSVACNRYQQRGQS